VRGSNFFELHEKFEEFYTDLLAKVDEVAERILTLGHKPVHAYSDYISLSRITEAKDVHDGEACVRGVLEGYQRLIELQREILSVASDADDEGTASQVGDYIREQEKTVWMLGAYLG
jgi:starvation-inducible DNA-binding protein